MDFFNAWLSTPFMELELLVMGFLFSRGRKRRPYFWIRFIGMGFAGILIVFWVEVAFYLITGKGFVYGGTSEIGESLFKLCFFLFIYFLAIGTLLFSYDERWVTAALIGASAYAVQHIAFNVSSLLSLLFLLLGANATTLKAILSIGVREICMAGGFLFVFLFMRKRYKATDTAYQGNAGRKLLVSSLVILICIVFSRFANDNPSRTLFSEVVEPLYAIVSCMLVIALQFSLLESDTMHEKVDTLGELLHQQREQYQLSKENIELINIKCHDLKHQISALRKDSSEKSIQEMENAVMIYDSALNTGNEALDVLLREKMLQCEKEHITLTCLVNGKLLSFMDEVDLYSLFGNAVSNAIESTKELIDPAKRLIALSTREVGNMVLLHIENPYQGELVFKDGLPQTTKEDNRFHGFGMQSMTKTAQKYGGEMTVDAHNGKFSLNFVFPITKPAK